MRQVLALRGEQDMSHSMRFQLLIEIEKNRKQKIKISCERQAGKGIMYFCKAQLARGASSIRIPCRGSPLGGHFSSFTEAQGGVGRC
jgi:hypothetical protein